MGIGYGPMPVSRDQSGGVTFEFFVTGIPPDIESPVHEGNRLSMSSSSNTNRQRPRALFI